MQALPAYILAGGASRRFGSDKARVRVDAVPLIVRLTRRVEPHVSRVRVVATHTDEYADLNLVTVGDLVPHRGPLGGLYTALCDAARHEWLLLLSCDLTEFRCEWLQALAAARTSEARIVAFQSEQWQPFPGLYHRDLTVIVQEMLGRDELSMRTLFQTVRAVSAPLPADWPTVPQANTPDELDRYRRER